MEILHQNEEMVLLKLDHLRDLMLGHQDDSLNHDDVIDFLNHHENVYQEMEIDHIVDHLLGGQTLNRFQRENLIDLMLDHQDLEQETRMVDLHHHENADREIETNHLVDQDDSLNHDQDLDDVVDRVDHQVVALHDRLVVQIIILEDNKLLINV